MATETTAGDFQADVNGEPVPLEGGGQANPANQASEAGRAPSEEYQAAVRRAEELLDRAAERVRPWASQAKRQLGTLAARMQEEAEDIWAEAQDIREQNRS